MIGAAAAAKAASFCLFLLLGFRVTRSRERHRSVSLLILYFLAVNVVAGVTQWDDWPFTSNTLAVGAGTDSSAVHWMEIDGVDRGGREWRIDPLTWSPMFDTVLQLWLYGWYPVLPPSQQREAGQFLLAHANAARARLQEGKRIGYDTTLGPLSAPYWACLARFRDVPVTPYRALRVYQIDYRIGDVADDPYNVRRTLFAEFRE